MHYENLLLIKNGAYSLEQSGRQKKQNAFEM